MTCRECGKFKECTGKLGATKYCDAVLAVDNVEAKCPNFVYGDARSLEFMDYILTKIHKRIEYKCVISKKMYPLLTVFVSRPLWEFLKRGEDSRYGIAKYSSNNEIGKIFGYPMRVYEGCGLRFFVCEDEGEEIKLCEIPNLVKKEDDTERKKAVITDGDSSYEFPVSIGDVVKCKVEDENHVVELLPYKVCGLAVKEGKQYVINADGDLNEIGTGDCILPERG